MTNYVLAMMLQYVKTQLKISNDLIAAVYSTYRV